VSWQTLHPEYYPDQLEAKRQHLIQALAPWYPAAPRVFTSTPSHYRMRAEFRIWHQGEQCDFAMFPPGGGAPQLMEQFPIANRQINRLMLELRQQLLSSRELSHKLFQVDFLTTQTGQALISLIYHRRLDTPWQLQAERLAKVLQAGIIGRSRKQKLVIGEDHLHEQLWVNGRTYTYRQAEQSFVQPNALVCEKMLGWAQQATAGVGGDLLELYCGLGNFTLPLSHQFDRVLATEVAKPSIALAQHNAEINQCHNIQFVRLSSEEVSEALSGSRVFRRIEEAEINLSAYDFRCVLVDPPRAGLDPATLSLVAGFEYIVYISCHLDSLTDNLATLAQTHQVEQVALFDQFPFTEHQETGVLLRRHKRTSLR